jgi:hypothetical protein
MRQVGRVRATGAACILMLLLCLTLSPATAGTCPKCGKAMQANWKFCKYDGARLGASKKTSSQAPKPARPGNKTGRRSAPRSLSPGMWTFKTSYPNGIIFRKDHTLVVRWYNERTEAKWSESGGKITFTDVTSNWTFPSRQCRWAQRQGELGLQFIHGDGLPVNSFDNPYWFTPYSVTSVPQRLRNVEALPGAWFFATSAPNGIVFGPDGSLSVRWYNEQKTAQWKESDGVISFSAVSSNWTFPTTACRWKIGEDGRLGLEFIHGDGLPFSGPDNPYWFRRQ